MLNRFTACLISLLICLPVLADTDLSATTPLTPFTANYTAKYKGMSLKASRTLQALGNNHYRFNSKASHFLFGSITESSEFTLQENRIRPDSYLMKRKILGSRRTEQALFDWNNDTVKATYKDQSNDIALAGDELDWLGYQLQLSQDLAQSQKQTQIQQQSQQQLQEEFHYKIVRRGQLKEYSFKVAGTEQIDTPMGQLDTIKLQRIGDKNKRQTTLWLSPEYQYLLVKFQRIENDGDQYSLFLKNVELQETATQ